MRQSCDNSNSRQDSENDGTLPTKINPKPTLSYFYLAKCKTKYMYTLMFYFFLFKFSLKKKTALEVNCNWQNKSVWTQLPIKKQVQKYCVYFGMDIRTLTVKCSITKHLLLKLYGSLSASYSKAMLTLAHLYQLVLDGWYFLR